MCVSSPPASRPRTPFLTTIQACAACPSAPLAIAGLVTGRLVGWTPEFGGSAGAQPSATPTLSVRAHADPCRALCFAAGSTALYSACAAGSLVSLDVATGRLSGRLLDAASPGAPITRLAPAAGPGAAAPGTPGGPAPLPPASFLAGDEAGGVVLWDPRSSKPALAVAGVHAGGADVTALLAAPGAGTAMSAGGDGVLAVTDLRTGRVAARSDPDEDELSSLALARGGRKVVSGSVGGVVSLWSWGHWAGCSDRWPLPRGAVSSSPSSSSTSRPSIEGLAHLPGIPGLPDALLAACDDGALRVLGILPTGVAFSVAGAHGGQAAPGGRSSKAAVRALEAVAVGNTAGGSPAAPVIVATIAMACRELRAWDGVALAGAAAGAGGVVSGAKQARKRKNRQGGGGGSSEDDGEEGEEEEEEGGAARPAAKAHPGEGNFFADLL